MVRKAIGDINGRRETCQNHVFFIPVYAVMKTHNSHLLQMEKQFSLFFNFTHGLFVTSKRFNSSTTPTRGAGARVKVRAQLSAPRTAPLQNNSSRRANRRDCVGRTTRDASLNSAARLHVVCDFLALSVCSLTLRGN